MTTPAPTVLVILKAARTLLTDPKCWTQGSLARLASGEPTYLVESSNAVCWCIMGATCRFDPLDSGQLADRLLRDHLPPGYYRSIGEFNDNPSTTHADVMSLFDRTIATIESIT